MPGTENEVALRDPPRDGVTAIRWHPSAGYNSLLVSSWDSTVRLYNSTENSLRTNLEQPCPVLDADFVDDSRAVSAGLDGIVRLHDFHSAAESVVGSHENSVRCVRQCTNVGPSCIVSGSWDHCVKLWDLRASDANVCSIRQPNKVLSLCTGVPVMNTSGKPLLVVATAGRQVVLSDLRKPGDALQRRESSLKAQTRCVAQMPSGEGYTIGSVDGRVAVEYVDPAPESQERKYVDCCMIPLIALHIAHALLPTEVRLILLYRFVFRSHRLTVGGVDTSFPFPSVLLSPCYFPLPLFSQFSPCYFPLPLFSQLYLIFFSLLICSLFLRLLFFLKRCARTIQK